MIKLGSILKSPAMEEALMDVIILGFGRKKIGFSEISHSSGQYRGPLNVNPRKNLKGYTGFELFNLGFLESVKGNKDRAAFLYERSCNRGVLRGCYHLGLLEEQRNNIEEAAFSYRRACYGGGLDGCHSLGLLEYKRGNKDEAAIHLENSCDKGDHFACTNLGVLGLKKANTSSF